MTVLQIVGRSSSLFTRLPLVFAEELGVAYELVPIYDMTELGPEVYAGNPALKLPILRSGGSTLFGALNICRAVAERASTSPAQIVWPEQLRDDLSRNTQELVWHCMAAQVQLVMGTLVGKLPTDNIYFEKARTGLSSSLAWLDTTLEEALRALPSERTLSVLEVSLFCLVEHLTFRPTVSVAPYAMLKQFARDFSERSSAKRTVYRFDVVPAT